MATPYSIHANLSGDETLHGKMQKIKAFIAENIASELSINTITQKFNLSASTLHRHFKKQVHQSYHQYIENIRIQKAFKLITEEDKMIKEAMYATGYKNRDTFNKAFKKIYGYPPSHFKTE